MTGKRCQLARIRGLIQREQNHRQIPLIAETVEQRFEGLHIIGGGGNIRAHVAAKLVHNHMIVIAHRAGMDLHHQAVIERHAGHFGEHLRPKQFGFRRTDRSLADLVIERRDL